MDFKGKIVKRDLKVLMFLLPRLRQLDSANSILNRGSTMLKQACNSFSDTGDEVTSDFNVPFAKAAAKLLR
jgi:hypothetical protein